MAAPSPESRLPVTYADVAAAAERIRGHAHRTPVLTSHSVDERTGASVFFKAENFQRMGAFKFRGAYNALSRLTPEQRRQGVLAFSSGNHAQAVALAGRELGVPAVIVMPQDAPAVKITATKGYGAEVVLYDRHTQDREAFSEALAKERGLHMIPPFNHVDIVAGQGTAAKELIEETGPLDYLFVPCGGGGLISGSAIAANHLSPGIKVIGIEPQAGDDATRSFRTKTLQSCHNPDTIADGARTHALGSITFPLVLAHVHDFDTVDDKELLAAMFYLWERMKAVVEPTGSLGAAGVFKWAEADRGLRGKRVGVILSGGNVDVRDIARMA